MATIFLKKRESWLRERMEDPFCPAPLLNNTYRQFSLLNQLLAAWRGIYQDYLKPQLGSSASLLDLGCGGGDLVLRLAAWAAQDGIKLELCAVDPDARALAFMASRARPPNIRLLRASSRDLVKAGERFDIVLSNHLLHHLAAAEVADLCQDTEQLTERFALHNDICRSDLAYLSFALLGLVFHRSLISVDGLLSIRRSFTTAELQAITVAPWRVETRRPYRNLLIYQP
jgi:2-polyprenyl-3-methyl-5-hydroxy-6-metoxy-1,4-benzoquinol methylase